MKTKLHYLFHKFNVYKYSQLQICRNVKLGFYRSTFLQLVNGSKNSILNWVLKLNFFRSLRIFLYVCLENPRQIFYSFTPLFLLYKPQIPTKQTGLTNRFVIPPKHLCSCVQKIKRKHDGGAHVVFLFPHITHGIVKYLIPKEICIAKWKKKLPAKKKSIHSQNEKKGQQSKRDLRFFYFTILSRLLSSE